MSSLLEIQSVMFVLSTGFVNYTFTRPYAGLRHPDRMAPDSSVDNHIWHCMHSVSLIYIRSLPTCTWGRKRCQMPAWCLWHCQRRPTVIQDEAPSLASAPVMKTKTMRLLPSLLCASALTVNSTTELTAFLPIILRVSPLDTDSASVINVFLHWIWPLIMAHAMYCWFFLPVDLIILPASTTEFLPAVFWASPSNKAFLMEVRLFLSADLIPLPLTMASATEVQLFLPTVTWSSLMNTASTSEVWLFLPAILWASPLTTTASAM